MIAKVLYSHESKFKAPDDSEVCGYQTGVLYNDQFGKDRCREIWTHVQFSRTLLQALIKSLWSRSR